MNKTDLVDAMAAKSGLSKADAAKALNAFTETIGETTKAGENVSLIGFGSFSIAERSARQGINPRTKETIEIPAKKYVKFKPGTALDL